MSGLTSIELGGQEPLAKFTTLSNALTLMQSALSVLAAAMPAGVAAKETGASGLAVTAFTNTGSTLITKGA
jgi:hypothetical protein